MKRGPKPQPTKLKLLRGNPGKRKLPADEPQPAAVVPECPDHLSDEARAEWDRISRELLEVGTITRCDRAALAAYCQTWARWVAAEREVAKLGLVVESSTGAHIANPYLAIANKALEQMRVFLIEFGLTPSSRTRVKVPTKEKKSDLAVFLAKGTSGKRA